MKTGRLIGVAVSRLVLHLDSLPAAVDNDIVQLANLN
jgi:hypothetical protein